MQPQEFSGLVDNIEAALVRFENTSNHAVLRAFLRNDMQNMRPSVSSSNQSSRVPVVEHDNENIFREHPGSAYI